MQRRFLHCQPHPPPPHNIPVTDPPCPPAFTRGPDHVEVHPTVTYWRDAEKDGHCRNGFPHALSVPHNEE